MSSSQSLSRQSNSGLDILIIALWFGLFSGIIEGLVFISAQFFGRMMGVSVEIIWISPLANALLFFSIGVVLALVSKFTARATIMRAAVFTFVFLSALAWLGVALIIYVNQYALVILSLGIAAAVTRRFQKAPGTTIRIWRRSLPVLIVAVLALMVVIQGGAWIKEQVKLARLPGSSQQNPNVLLVVVDTLRADHLSSYGYQRQTSPNIDRIGKEGVIFKNAYSTSSYTLPSHVSLMTGQYNYQHGSEWDTFDALRNNPVPTLAEALQSEGYRTAGLSANLFWVTSEQGFDRGFIHFEDYFTTVEDMIQRTAFGRMIEKQVARRLGYEDIPARKSAGDINNAALNWIDKHEGAPYFLFVNYMDTHEPYLPPQPYRGVYSGQDEPGGILNCSVERCDPPLSPEERQAEIDAYDGAINYVDRQIFELIEGLKQQGDFENTIVIITSDHGEAFNEHSLYLHGNSLYKEEIHVPLIFWWPDHVPAGISVDQPVTNAAVPATLFDLLSVADTGGHHLESLRPVWGELSAEAQNAPVLSEISKQSWKPERAPITHNSLKSIVETEGHLILGDESGFELYDWVNDPEESANLSDESDYREILDGLFKKLETISSDG